MQCETIRHPITVEFDPQLQCGNRIKRGEKHKKEARLCKMTLFIY